MKSKNFLLTPFNYLIFYSTTLLVIDKLLSYIRIISSLFLRIVFSLKTRNVTMITIMIDGFRVRVMEISRREWAWEPWVGGRDTFGKTLEGWETFGRENLGFGGRIH